MFRGYRPLSESYTHTIRRFKNCIVKYIAIISRTVARKRQRDIDTRDIRKIRWRPLSKVSFVLPAAILAEPMNLPSSLS